MSDKVKVSGAPGYADFQATVIPGLDRVRYCETGEYMSVVSTQEGELLAIPSRCVTPIDAPAPLQVGDKIRILRDRYSAAMVEVGDVLEVLRVTPSNGGFETNAPRLVNIISTWGFDLADEGTGWKRVR